MPKIRKEYTLKEYTFPTKEANSAEQAGDGSRARLRSVQYLEGYRHEDLQESQSLH